jgi:alkaline phosphatase D
MKKFCFSILVFCLLLSCKKFNTDFCERNIQSTKPNLVTRIAFGSCASENKDQPILNTVVSKSPDLFIYLGDNVYCDTKNEKEMRNEYSKLSCKPEFQNLISSVFTLAIWDDHDYGQNDSGLEYCMKEKSKNIFLEFWKEPDTSSRWNHNGIYHAEYFGDSSHRVQIILLDCRTFRTKQKESNGNYIPDLSSNSTILGEEQWVWLEGELRKPAELRIICTSTQFGTEYNGYETWSNYPLEISRMVNMIRNIGAEHLLFISGDVHYSELSKRIYPNLFPIYDFTSSGLTQIDDYTAANLYRINNAVLEQNAGFINIDWTNRVLNLEIINVSGSAVFQYGIPFSELEL